MQYVRVEVSEGRAYTYKWDDEAEQPLLPNERVLLPSNMVQDKTFEGTVLRTIHGPDWDGPIKDVISRVGEPPLSDEDLDLL
jgi:hypothetical protein